MIEYYGNNYSKIALYTNINGNVVYNSIRKFTIITTITLSYIIMDLEYQLLIYLNYCTALMTIHPLIIAKLFFS